MSVSVWTPFYESIPNDQTFDPFRVLRSNIFTNEVAMVAYAAVSAAPTIIPGWSYTNSVTRGEGTPGTAAAPLRKYWYSGTGNNKRWVKAVITWGPPVKVALYYSSNNEATYVPMLDADGNYVLTATYTGADLNASTWGNVP